MGSPDAVVLKTFCKVAISNRETEMPVPGVEKSAGLCLPSLLRREKMPGYANEQSGPALCIFNIFSVDPISHTFVSHASVETKRNRYQI